jgi:hypothetical protein
MANTFTALAAGVALPTTAAAKTLLSLYNLHATEKLNVCRVWVQNTGTAAVTPAFQVLSLGRHTTDQTTGSTTVTPIKHDTDSAGLTNATCKHSPTTSVTLVDTFAQIFWSGDEYATGVNKLENLNGLPLFALVFDAGYGDTNIEPIVLNQNEGLAVTSAGVASGVGTVDVCFEFYVS